jgi:DNA-binding CsgD family transcriptional regulator
MVASCVQSIAPITLVQSGDVNAWARAAGSALVEFFGHLTPHRPGPIGAWVALVGPHGPAGHSSALASTSTGGFASARRVTNLAVVGYQGLSPEQAEDVALRAATDAATWQAWAEHCGYALGGGREPLFITQPSGNDELVRATMPLGQFLRGVQPAGPDLSRLLVWQVDGRAGVWTPGPSELAAAELIAVALSKGFELGVIAHERRREGLTARLSPSQAPILPLLAQGLNQRQIGERIGRSLHTVHDHVKSIYATLGIKSRYELFVLWHGGDPSSVAGIED